MFYWVEDLYLLLRSSGLRIFIYCCVLVGWVYTLSIHALCPSHQTVLCCFTCVHTLNSRSLPIAPNCLVLFRIWTHAHSSLSAHLTKLSCLVLFHVFTHCQSTLSVHLTKLSCIVSDLDTHSFLALCPSHRPLVLFQIWTHTHSCLLYTSDAADDC